MSPEIIAIAVLALVAVGIALAAHSKASAAPVAAATPAPAPPPPVDHVGIINAVAAVVAAGQPAAQPGTKPLDPSIAAALGLPPGYRVVDTPPAQPAPAAPAGPPPASKALNFSASDQGWKNGALGAVPVIVTVAAELTAAGFVMSMTRVYGDDTQVAVAGPGVLSGTANDWTVTVPPTAGPVTLAVTGDHESVYGFAYRPGQ